MRNSEAEIVDSHFPRYPRNFTRVLWSGLLDVAVAVGLLNFVSESVHMVWPSAEPVMMKHVDHYELETAPAGPNRHRGLRAWLLSQPDTIDGSVKQDPWSARTVTLTYLRPMDCSPVDPPWKQLGYVGRLGDLTQQATPCLTGYVPFAWLVSFAAVIAFALIRFGSLARSRDTRFCSHGKLAAAIGWGVVGAAIVAPAAVLSHSVTRFIPMNKWHMVASLDYGTSGWWMGLVAVLFVGPMAEELVFRGLLFGRLASAGHVWVGAFTTAFVFAWYHSDWHNFLLPFFVGLTAAAVYYRSRSILSPIIVHIAANAFALWHNAPH